MGRGGLLEGLRKRRQRLPGHRPERKSVPDSEIARLFFGGAFSAASRLPLRRKMLKKSKAAEVDSRPLLFRLPKPARRVAPPVFSYLLISTPMLWRATVDEDGHYCFAVAL